MGGLAHRSILAGHTPMKLAILSRAPKAYSTLRLRAAAEQRGHVVRVLNTLRFGIDLTGDEPDLQYRGKHLSDYDAILPRIGNSITYFGTAVVIKLLEGTQGIGVILAPEVKVAEAIIETLQSTNQNVLIQRFVKESRGRDIRALVVGDRVVAAMRRRASGDEFRSNVHRGGSVEPVELDEEFERVAVRSAQIMGLRVAGVDMLEGRRGPQVMEVNSSPGLEGIETATKLDVAGAIVDYVANQVAFPDIDVQIGR